MLTVRRSACLSHRRQRIVSRAPGEGLWALRSAESPPPQRELHLRRRRLRRRAPLRRRYRLPSSPAIKRPRSHSLRWMQPMEGSQSHGRSSPALGYCVRSCGRTSCRRPRPRPLPRLPHRTPLNGMKRCSDAQAPGSRKRGLPHQRADAMAAASTTATYRCASRDSSPPGGPSLGLASRTFPGGRFGAYGRPTIPGPLSPTGSAFNAMHARVPYDVHPYPAPPRPRPVAPSDGTASSTSPSDDEASVSDASSVAGGGGAQKRQPTPSTGWRTAQRPPAEAWPPTATTPPRSPRPRGQGLA